MEDGSHHLMYRRKSKDLTIPTAQDVKLSYRQHLAYGTTNIKNDKVAEEFLPR